jgi:hypothetical protein
MAWRDRLRAGTSDPEDEDGARGEDGRALAARIAAAVRPGLRRSDDAVDLPDRDNGDAEVSRITNDKEWNRN